MTPRSSSGKLHIYPFALVLISGSMILFPKTYPKQVRKLLGYISGCYIVVDVDGTFEEGPVRIMDSRD